ncbi:MAG: SANT/Myb domain-containing protein [Bacteroidales bacterium]|nr:SANT/Myb domain-containing protein [Bacteroidales bacterium]
MSTRKRWTKEEEEILGQAIKANPHNLSKAFREVAGQLGRTEEAVSRQWYTKTRINSICFVTVSQGKELKNGKNYVPMSGHTKTPSASNKTLWEKLKALLGWR